MSKQYLDREGLQVVANKTEKKFRYSTMPVADSSFADKIVEYTGETTANYTKGYFYTAVDEGSGYSWSQVNVQPEGIDHWIGTQAEYDLQKDNIPTGSIVALTDEIDTTYDSGIYSTDETVTGQRWIDGKPIYRKVVDCGAMPDSTEKTVAHNIADIDFIVRYYGITYNPTAGGFITLPFSYPNIESDVGLGLTRTDVVIHTGMDRTAYSVTKVIIEYTKTTD